MTDLLTGAVTDEVDDLHCLHIELGPYDGRALLLRHTA